jgi:hypothetical protein
MIWVWIGLLVLASIAFLVIFCMLSVSAQQDELAERWEEELREELGQQEKIRRAA